jgi:hypothetical protein
MTVSERTVVLRERFRSGWAAQRRRLNPAAWFAAQSIAKDLRDAGLEDRTRAYLGECWQRLDAKVATLAIEERGDSIMLRFADTLVFERWESTGEIQAWQWGNVDTQDCKPSAIDLRFALPFHAWWRPMLDRHVALPDWLACEVTHPADDALRTMGPLINLMRLQWLHGRLTAFAKHCYDLRAMGSRLRREVGIDREVTTLAAAMWPSAGVSIDVDARLYRLAARHRHALEEIRTKAPNVLKIAGGVLMNDEAAERIDLGLLRDRLAAEGFGRAAWKRLLRSSLRPFWRGMVNREGGFTKGDWAALRLWLRLEALLPNQPLLAARLWRVFHPTRGDFASLHARIGEMPDAFLHRLAAYARRPGIAARERLLQILATLVHWMAYTAEPGNLGLERGWQRLLEQATADARRLVARREAERATLPVLGVKHYAAAGFEARAITTRTALAEAAIALRNCADDLADKPIAKHLAFFEVLGSTGTRVGMAAYFSSVGMVITHDVRGRFNRAPSPALKAFAESLRKQLATTPVQQPYVTYRKRRNVLRPGATP